MTTLQTLPVGYNLIPGGKLHGEKIPFFGMKETPVTNAEWREGLVTLGEDRYILLHHDWESGESKFLKKAKTIEEAIGGPLSTQDGINFDHGDVMMLGSLILLKMVDNPSVQYDNIVKKPDNEEESTIFSGDKQPVMGISYFHAKAWCFLKTIESGGQLQFDLPTDLQYEYVASAGGTKEYGTETGTLFKGNKKKKKLAHIDVWQNGQWTTVAVDDKRYIQKLPFKVQATGNILRWIKFNPQFKQAGNYFCGPYGLRGGTGNEDSESGRASFRSSAHPQDHSGRLFGFQPVINDLRSTSSSAKKPSGRGKPAPRRRA